MNRGLRSSSLHYAACFGRPQIVKVRAVFPTKSQKSRKALDDPTNNAEKFGGSSQTLLRYGANPDLRDEDGKTPLDKARERGDEGHREVIQILQSPGKVVLHNLPDSRAACVEFDAKKKRSLVYPN